MARVFFRFACGARLPRNGSIESECNWSSTRKRDGRPKFCVASTDGERRPGRPIMPDGSEATCWDCPAKQRESGRKSQRAFPAEFDPKPGEPIAWSYYVTCYPAVIHAEQPGIAALADAARDPEGGMGGD